MAFTETEEEEEEEVEEEEEIEEKEERAQIHSVKDYRLFVSRPRPDLYMGCSPSAPILEGAHII